MMKLIKLLLVTLFVGVFLAPRAQHPRVGPHHRPRRVPYPDNGGATTLLDLPQEHDERAVFYARTHILRMHRFGLLHVSL